MPTQTGSEQMNAFLVLACPDVLDKGLNRLLFLFSFTQHSNMAAQQILHVHVYHFGTCMAQYL